MKHLRRSYATALASLCLITSAPSWALPCNAVPFNPTITTTADAGIDTALYAELVASAMGEGHNKGWSSTLSDAEGHVIASINQGLARTACDPGGERTFNASTETPWGSVSKILTTAAALRVVEGGGASLDSALVNFLPVRWRNQVHNRFVLGENGSGPVTLRMMLSHRGGFQHSSCQGRTIKERLIDGDLVNCGTEEEPELAPAVGTRSYANMSQAIFQIALAYMEEPAMMQSAESFAADMSTADYDFYIQNVTNSHYRNYVKNEILNPNGISAVCSMAENQQANPSGNFTLWFDSDADSLGTLPYDDNESCAAGAWMMSSLEMAKFLRLLQDGETILSPDTYALMEQSWTESLGWWRSDWQLGTVYAHNGGWSGTSSSVRLLPGGYISTAVYNSGGFEDWRDFFDDAYRTARGQRIRTLHQIVYRPG